MDLFEEFLLDMQNTARDTRIPDAATFMIGLRKMAEGPEVLGLSEGQFAAPMDQVLQALAAVIAHEFKMHQEYVYYAEMLRGTNRDGLADLFTRHAYDENRDAQYFLKRMSALQPGGIPIPMSPTPTPLADAPSILNAMIAGEQQAILMLRQLRQVVGENPMGFQIEQMLADEQKHLDSLWQFMDANPAPAPAKAKMAAARLAITKRANDVIMQEQAMSLAQAQNEKAYIVDQLQQTRQELAGAQEQAAMAGQQAEQASAQMQQAVQQSQQAQQDALAGQTAAAEHATGKMRLAQRIQQMRQTLADLASQDPVGEEGVAADPTMTSTQQQAMAEQEAAAQQGQQPQTAEQQQQVEQAQRAQTQAQIQTQQAQQATGAKQASHPFA
jgi:bacterioferritin (cytochrome b1)